MAEPGSRNTSTRIRAAKACQRCSQRKIKCDGATSGLPCSRCRSDGMQDCKLNSSRRGCYQRKGRSAPPSSTVTRFPDAANRQHEISEQAPFVDNVFAVTSNDDAVATANQQVMVASFQPFPTPEWHPRTEYAADFPSRSSSDGDTGFSAAERQAVEAVATANIDTATP
jgi:hypothetical protein